MEYSRDGKLLYQKFREFLVPSILASMSSSLALLSDGLIVGSLIGPESMASVNVSMPVMQALVSLSLLIGLGSSTLIAIAKGRKDASEADRVFTSGVIFAVVAGLVLTAFAMAGHSQLAAMLAPASMVPMADAYLTNLLAGTVLILIVPIFVYFLRTDGMVKAASAMLIMANVINIGLDYTFIGFFDMGIGGSSLATVCSYALSMSIVVVYFRSSRRTLSFISFRRLRLQTVRSGIWQIVKTGSPGALSTMLLTVRMFCINIIVRDYLGADGMVILSVCMMCLSLSSMFLNGTASTMLPILGVLYGERDYRGILMVVRYALRFALAMTALLVICMELWPTVIFGIFNATSPAILADGPAALRLFALSIPGMTVAYLFIYYYMTLRKQAVANTLCVVESVLLLVPLMLLFGELWGGTGIWAAFPVAEFGALAILVAYTRIMVARSRGRYRDMFLLEQDTSPVLYDVSLSPAPDDGARLSAEVWSVLDGAGVGRSTNDAVTGVLRAMSDYVAVNCGRRGKPVRLDIRIVSDNATTTLTLRDNVRLAGGEVHDDALCGSVSAMTADPAVTLDCGSTLRLNHTTITIRKSC